MMKDIDRHFYTVSEDTRQLVNTLKITIEACETYRDAIEKLPTYGNSVLAHGNAGMDAFRALWDGIFLSIRHSTENHLRMNGTVEHPENEI